MEPTPPTHPTTLPRTQKTPQTEKFYRRPQADMLTMEIVCAIIARGRSQTTRAAHLASATPTDPRLTVSGRNPTQPQELEHKQKILQRGRNGSAGVGNPSRIWRPKNFAHDACHAPGAPHSSSPLPSLFANHLSRPQQLREHKTKGFAWGRKRQCWQRKSFAQSSPEGALTRRRGDITVCENAKSRIRNRPFWL